MSTVNFLNTGKKELEDLQEQKYIRLLTLTRSNPIGIRLPLSAGKEANESLFAMNFTLQKQISNNFKTFLSTKKGELLCKPDFGLSISQIYNRTDISLEDKENIVMKDIKKNVNKYFPDISLKDFQSILIPDKPNDQPDYYVISISYGFNFPGTENINHVVELTIKRSV